MRHRMQSRDWPSQFLTRVRLEALEERIVTLSGSRLEPGYGMEAGPARAKVEPDCLSAMSQRLAEKIRAGAPLTRGETAFHLDVSARTVQRMEADGRLSRCPGWGTLVRYAARDVLRLASAR